MTVALILVLGSRKGIQPVNNFRFYWVVVVIWQELVAADLDMFQCCSHHYSHLHYLLLWQKFE